MSCGDALIACGEERDRLRGRCEWLESRVAAAEANTSEFVRLQVQMNAIHESVTRLCISMDEEFAIDQAEFGGLLRIVFHNDIPKMIAKALREQAAATT